MNLEKFDGKMSSIQIAELTGKLHKHVIRDIRTLLEHGVAETNFGLGDYLDANNQSRPCYNLTKKGCLILASGYDAVLREKIIDRWEELEHKQEYVLPKNYLEALKMLVVSEESIISLNKEIEVQRPKVEFYDTVTQSDVHLDFAEVAKIINKPGFGRNNLMKFLRSQEVLRDNNTPYQIYVDRGYFKIVENNFVKDNEIQIALKTVVLQKGVDYIIKLIK